MRDQASMTAGTDHPQPRQVGLVNWLGLWTLYKKEVFRFLKVFIQTIAAPVATTLLFMMVFSLAFGTNRGDIHGVAYTTFLIPGLMMMGILNQSFNNSSSSLIVAKVQGNAVDFLMPPISPAELAAAFIGGAVTRGVLVGGVTGLAIIPFVELPIAHLWAVLYFGLGAAVMLSALGVMAGVWAEKFDHLSVVTNFLIMPMTFLSGTFYSVTVLPEPFETFTHYNPFFYMIDGFRYGFIGSGDSQIWVGVVTVGVLNIGVVTASYILLRTGWRLKS